MACLGLLSLGSDLDGHGHCLLKVGLGHFVYWLDVLDVDVSDHQVVLLQHQTVLHLPVGVHSENTLANQPGTRLVERVEVSTGHCRPYLIGHQVAQVAHEVSHIEDLLALFRDSLVHVELPVVRQS